MRGQFAHAAADAVFPVDVAADTDVNPRHIEVTYMII
jgi:hypothetical protein